MDFPAIPQSPSAATKSVQHLLNVIAPASGVKVDGVVGPRTRAVFQGLPAPLKSAVESLAQNRNPSTLAALSATAVSRPERRRIQHDEAMQLARMAIAKHGTIPVSGTDSMGLMEFLLSLEPLGNRRDGYVIESVSPSGLHIGIYQMGKPAWQDVQDTRRMPSGLTWQATCFDPQLATEAAVIYLQLTARRLRMPTVVGRGTRARTYPAVKAPLTKEILYSAYNQGVAGFKQGAPAMAAQSGPAKSILLSALRDAGVRS